MPAVLHRSLLILAAPLAACAAAQPPGPYYGDEQYLVFGVHPDAEAAALAGQIVASGYPLASRVNGQSFTALGFTDEHGLPAKVRIVTVRGAALALDPEPVDPLHAGVRYRLLDAPLSDTNDADGDGFEEVFVEQQPQSGEMPCILVYRVRDSGFVDPVPGKDYALARDADVHEGAWLDPQFCPDEAQSGTEDENANPDATAGPDGGAPSPAGTDAPATSAPASGTSEPAGGATPANPTPNEEKSGASSVTR